MAVAFPFAQAQATRLLGRAVELDTIEQRLIRDHVRLLSLTGPAGVGTTRLALEARVRLSNGFPGGVTLVDLSPVRLPSRVLPAIAHELGLTDSGTRPLFERLQGYLRERELRLILDNFEQVLSAAGEIAELVAAAPGLSVLVTSRVSLRLRWEQTLRILPLPVPDLDTTISFEDLVQIPSIALFVERAQAQRSDYLLTEQQAELLTHLTRQLDGLPLAIELAAANMNTLPLAVIARQLDRHLQTLQWDAQDLPDRQRSLQAAIGCSYDLLPPSEQHLFRRLGVFLGRVALDAVEAVVGDVDEEIALAGMVSLAEKSLVLPVQAQDNDPEPSFGSLETVRQYAREQLSARGELDEASRAHAQYFVDLAERADPRLRRGGQEVWYSRLESELDNLRAALRWLLDHQEHEQALRLAGALGYFWWLRGYNTEAPQWLEETLDRAPEVDPAVRTRALLRAGLLLTYKGELQGSKSVLEKALALAVDRRDGADWAQALTYLGLVYAAAFVPDQGDTLFSLGTGFAQSDVVNHFDWTGTPFAFGSLALIDPAYFQQLFAQDLPTQKAAALNLAQQPVAFIPLFVTPSGPVAWHTLPSWYEVSGADRMIDPAEERFMAQRAGATTVEYNTASHVGGITRFAGRSTDLIEQAVHATSK